MCTSNRCILQFLSYTSTKLRYNKKQRGLTLAIKALPPVLASLQHVKTLLRNNERRSEGSTLGQEVAQSFWISFQVLKASRQLCGKVHFIHLHPTRVLHQPAEISLQNCCFVKVNYMQGNFLLKMRPHVYYSPNTPALFCNAKFMPPRTNYLGNVVCDNELYMCFLCEFFFSLGMLIMR